MARPSLMIPRPLLDLVLVALLLAGSPTPTCAGDPARGDAYWRAGTKRSTARPGPLPRYKPFRAAESYWRAVPRKAARAKQQNAMQTPKAELVSPGVTSHPSPDAEPPTAQYVAPASPDRSVAGPLPPITETGSLRQSPAPEVAPVTSGGPSERPVVAAEPAPGPSPAPAARGSFAVSEQPTLETTPAPPLSLQDDSSAILARRSGPILRVGSAPARTDLSALTAPSRGPDIQSDPVPVATIPPPAKPSLAHAGNFWRGTEARTSLDRHTTASGLPLALAISLPSPARIDATGDVSGPGDLIAVASRSLSDLPAAFAPQQLRGSPTATPQPTWPPIRRPYAPTAQDFEFRGKTVLLATTSRSDVEEYCAVSVRHQPDGEFVIGRSRDGRAGASGEQRVAEMTWLERSASVSTVFERTGAHSFTLMVQDPLSGAGAAGNRQGPAVHCYFDFSVSELGCSVKHARIATSHGVGEHRPEKSEGKCEIADETIASPPQP